MGSGRLVIRRRGRADPRHIGRTRLMRKLFGGWFALALVASGVMGSAAPAAERDADALEGRYIVVYEDSVEAAGKETDKREDALGFDTRFRYREAVKGFAARLSDAQVKQLRGDAAVDFVVPDRPVHAAADVVTGDVVPVGVRRIEAATTTSVHGASGVGVAVIDTGIDPNHPDLAGQIAGGKNCIDPTKSPNDDHGHGTHVAGTIAAANNGSGVVGVAPGTALYSVKVL